MDRKKTGCVLRNGRCRFYRKMEAKKRRDEKENKRISWDGSEGSGQGGRENEGRSKLIDTSIQPAVSRAASLTDFICAL
jgi:hypothetical protein